jgi:hypothetical protein
MKNTADKNRFPSELGNQPDGDGTAQRRAERIAHHDHRHNGGPIVLGSIFDLSAQASGSTITQVTEREPSDHGPEQQVAEDVAELDFCSDDIARLNDLGNVYGVQPYYDIIVFSMRRLLEILAAAAIIVAVFSLSALPGLARPEYGRRTQKECNFCHPKDSWNLNDAGKYYRDHKYSLQGYVPPKTDGKSGKN